MWLSFLSQEPNIWGAEHLLCALYTHPPTSRASPSYSANAVCSERKPLLQMVLLSALNGGFLSSLVVMMAPTCSLALYFPFLSVFFLAPTDPESTKTHLSPHLFSTTQKRKWLISLLRMHIFGTYKGVEGWGGGRQNLAGPFCIQPGRLMAGMNADQCFLLENVWYIQKIPRRNDYGFWGGGESWSLFE